MTKHTPGPWAHQDNITTYDFIVTDNSTICRIEQYRESQWYADGTGSTRIPLDERIANAHMIAAAPDMYKALKELMHEAHLNMVGGAGHLIDNAQWALNKADGKE